MIRRITIMVVLALVAGTAIYAQKAEPKQMVVYCNDGQKIRIDINRVDSITFEEEYIDAYESIDLGLSVLWATCNIGSTTPEGFGDYFAWGETQPKQTYSEENYLLKNGSSFQNIGKNITGTIYDAAHQLWEGDWRMPTIAEIDELTSLCVWTWTAQNGVSGYRITGPSGNSIFLPAAGQMRGAEETGKGSQGYYWSSTLSDEYPSAAYNLNFTGYTGHWSANRSYGFTIRAVRNR